MTKYNNRHQNNQRAALKYLASVELRRAKERGVTIRLKIALVVFSLTLAAFLHFYARWAT